MERILSSSAAVIFQCKYDGLLWCDTKCWKSCHARWFISRFSFSTPDSWIFYERRQCFVYDVHGGSAVIINSIDDWQLSGASDKPRLLRRASVWRTKLLFFSSIWSLIHIQNTWSGATGLLSGRYKRLTFSYLLIRLKIHLKIWDETVVSYNVLGLCWFCTVCSLVSVVTPFLEFAVICWIKSSMNLSKNNSLWCFSWFLLHHYGCSAVLEFIIKEVPRLLVGKVAVTSSACQFEILSI